MSSTPKFSESRVQTNLPCFSLELKDEQLWMFLSQRLLSALNYNTHTSTIIVWWNGG